MDTQSVKTSTNVPLDTQGIDAGKKIIGRERGIITDTLGLLLAVIVTAASVSDNVIGNAYSTKPPRPTRPWPRHASPATTKPDPTTRLR